MDIFDGIAKEDDVLLGRLSTCGPPVACLNQSRPAMRSGFGSVPTNNGLRCDPVLGKEPQNERQKAN